MSYREMRNFTEMMRGLGYNRLISMENFRTPNFQLISEILQWLVTRYDQNADISSSQNIDTEQDRVIFIKMVAHFMMTRAHVRLNTKRLYQADGYAVRELLKVTTLLYNSMLQSRLEDDDNGNDLSGFHDILDSNKLKEIKDTRQLASQLISKGATLSDMLRREVDLREDRVIALSNQLETGEVERAIENSIRGVEQEKHKQELALNNIASDEATLDSKIEKKKQELERNQKRLSTLQSVRPAYMDEYEQLEEELNSLYSEYLTTFRNLAWLENQYEDLVRQQMERVNGMPGGLNNGEEGEMTLKKMADQLRKSEVDWSGDGGRMKNAKGDDFDDLLDDDEGDEELNGTKESRVFGVDNSGNRGPKSGSTGRNFGGMGGGDNLEDDEDDDEDDDDDDEDDEDDDEESTESEDDDDEDSEILEDNDENVDNRYDIRSGKVDARLSHQIMSGDNPTVTSNGVGRPRGAEYNSRVSKTRRRGAPPGDIGDDF